MLTGGSTDISGQRLHERKRAPRRCHPLTEHWYHGTPR